MICKGIVIVFGVFFLSYNIVCKFYICKHINVHCISATVILISSSETFRCGGNFFAPEGEFKSPRFPNSYPNSYHCVWKISTDPFRSIALGIKDGSFDVEQGSSIYSCNHDSLSVYDGENKTTRRLGTYCGSGMRTFHTVSSSGRHLYVEFTSDWQQRRSGFQLKYVTYFTGELNAVCYDSSFHLLYVYSSLVPGHHAD